MATQTTQRKAKASPICGPPPEAEHLPCPRCDSINTKFCYYNNYNFSQPRHFCKSCRRYWTHGGTLRDIPMGGATRKNAKRSRTTSTTTAAAASPVLSSGHRDFRHLPAAASQLLVQPHADHGGLMPFGGDAKMGGSFTSLLMNNGQGNGLVALGGFGIGLDDVGFGLGRTAVWPFQEVVEGRPAGGSGGVSTVGAQTWQLENGEGGGFVGAAGDYFAFPDLAIPTPASVFK